MDSFIDIYCERIGPGLWAEPLNALTNAAFIIAAILALYFGYKEKQLDAGTLTLVFLLLCIGIGSTLLHTFATRWAGLADVIPILLFQIAFLWFYSLRVIGLGTARTAALFVFYILTTLLFGSLPSHWLNGSLQYAPAFLFLCGFAFWHYRHADKNKTYLALASFILLISLTFRSVDMLVCPLFPYGSHFMWHICNGTLLYLTIRAYSRNI